MNRILPASLGLSVAALALALLPIAPAQAQTTGFVQRNKKRRHK